MRRPPSKPKPFKRADRPFYYGSYWADALDDNGAIMGREKVQVPLYDENGERVVSPRKAEKACDSLYEGLIAAWKQTISGTTDLESYKDQYLTNHFGREGTTRSYETKLSDFLEYLRETCSVSRFFQTRREHIKAYLDNRLEQVKLTTVHGDLRAIRAFFNEAIKDKQIGENPSKGIRLPKLGNGKASEGFFLPSEMDAIVEHCRKTDQDWHPIFAGFRYAPFRREELCFLEWTDLDLSKDLIYIRDEKPTYGWYPKRTGRTMDLHPSLKSIIETIEPEEVFVFPSPKGVSAGDPVTERRELGRRAWRKIKTICRALKLEESDPTGSWKRRFPLGPHLKAFRSGISCELQLKGAPLAYVQHQLGHHDQSMTLEHYTHIIPDLMGSLTRQFIRKLGEPVTCSSPVSVQTSEKSEKQ